jgi:sugar O-acyltransferase (sialic acid O-acetyltransferase NeuD family)
MSSPPDVVFFGTAGHALSLAESAERRDPPLCTVVAYVDDVRGGRGESIDGKSILSFDQWREAATGMPIFVAVGDPRARQTIVKRIVAAGGRFASLYRVGSPIANDVAFGEGTIVFPLVTIGPGAVIGKHVQIMPLVSIDAECRIGDFATICPSSTIYGRVVLEAGAFIGVGARIVNETEDPLVVGAWTTVGAGAVVEGSIAAGRTVAGNPARDLRGLAAARANEDVREA